MPSTSKEPSPDRTEMLRGKPEVVGRFMQLTVPILVDVYAASVVTTVRIKTLTGLRKAISYLEADGIERVLTVSGDITGFLMQDINQSSFRSLYFASSILLSNHHRPSLLALCNSSSSSFPRSQKSTDQPSGGRVYSTKSSCLPTVRWSPRRPVAATKTRTRTFPMLRQSRIFHPLPSRFPPRSLPEFPVSRSCRRCHWTPRMQ